MQSTPPSVIARAVAAALWPDVQHQVRLAPGVYQFDCAGHGGIVAHFDTAAGHLQSHAVSVARAYTLAEICLVVRDGRRVKRYTSIRYTRASLLELAERLPQSTELHEVWVGEDCNWAMIAWASEAARGGLGRRYNPALTAPDVLERARSCVQRWNEWFLAEVEPGYVPLPDGGIAHQAIRDNVLAASGVLRHSLGYPPRYAIPAGMVRVEFRGAEGRHAEYLMARSTYDAVPFDYPASPETYAQHGPIEQVEGPAHG